MENPGLKKWWSKPERLTIFGLLIALVFTVSGFEIASASIPDSSGVIHTCYKTSAKVPTLKVTQASSCPNGYSSLNWNQTGPASNETIEATPTVSVPNTHVNSEVVHGTFTLSSPGHLLLTGTVTVAQTASSSYDEVGCAVFVNGVQVGLTQLATLTAFSPSQVGATDMTAHGLSVAEPVGTVSVDLGCEQTAGPDNLVAELGDLTVVATQ